MSEESILHLIPQKPPFVMIDKLLYTDDQCTKTSFCIKKENMLVINGEFCEAGLMENMAQTAAAGAKYRAILENKSGANLESKSGASQENKSGANMESKSDANHGNKSVTFRDNPVAIGYIASVKNLEINTLPKIGEELNTEVKIENKIFDFILITGKITSNNSLVAQCEMKVFTMI